MGSDKDRFLIEPEVHNGQLCALGYGCVIRILLTGANAQWGSKYYALTGNAPADPRRGECAARYGCFDGETVMSCAGKPDCNGGPVPELASDLIQNMLPTERLTIQLSRTIQLRPLDGEGGPGENAPCAYLYDRDCNPKVRILVFDCPADTNLCYPLQDYCEAENISPGTVAFHVYQITHVPAVGTPADLLSLAGKLIAIPVLFCDCSSHAERTGELPTLRDASSSGELPAA